MANVNSQLELLPPPVCSVDASAAGPARIRPLQIGRVEIGFPVIQAALSGYSDWPMRVVARRLGAPYTIAEVLIDRFVLDLKDRERTRHHLLVTDEEHPVGAQLMGSDPECFGPAAARLAAAGFDVIDINFGCPVRSAVGGCRGGYHLSQPDIALDIVSRVRDAVPPDIPVTVKMRRGIDGSEESRERFFRILDGAFERGIAGITVHGRTVEQKYVGPSNWDFLRAVKQHAGDRVIIGSGDVFTAQSCLDMLRCTGVDGVSVARGAIGNPWVFRQARDLAVGRTPASPSLAEQARVLRMQLDLCRQIYDERKALSAIRKHSIRFSRHHPDAEQTRNAFAAAKSLTAWEQILATAYDGREDSLVDPA